MRYIHIDYYYYYDYYTVKKMNVAIQPDIIGFCLCDWLK